MKIVIAPDSFKDSMTAAEAANAIARGIKQVDPTCQIGLFPLADGGEGTVDALIRSMDGEKVRCTVTGPTGERVEAFYGLQHDTAIIEIAAASGIQHLPVSKRNPMHMTSYGVGELLLHALDKGVRRFIIGLGGSATNDGGIGMLQALGAKITNKYGETVAYGARGVIEVEYLSFTALDARLKESSFQLACDVTNPLVGGHGATYVYGPQKGLLEKQLAQVDQAMERYASLLEKATGEKVLKVEGAGAAGGMGAACMSVLKGRIHRGIDVITEMTDLETHIAEADLVITGEGSLDSQTMYGKVPFGVAQLARKHNVCVIGLAGKVQSTDVGLDAVFSIANGAMTIQEAIKNGETLLTQLTTQVFRLYQAARKK